MNQTALYEEHLKAGGKLIDFGGWELPVQYTGIIDEHQTCRSSCGLFDVSHMGEIQIKGNRAAVFVDELVTNLASTLSIGQAQYTAMCEESGGIVDDLVIYRRGEDNFLLVVNASNTQKDFNHILGVLSNEPSKWEDLKISNQSDQFTQIALQGRNAPSILKELTCANLDELKTYWFCESKLNHVPALIARTGYTGEDGFELYIAWNEGPQIWQALMKVGEKFGLKPCGLGARDTLRMEMRYPLYGHELSNKTLPLETGLGWVVKMDKPYFVGKQALIDAKAKGLQKTLVGLRPLERGIPRQNCSVLSDEGELIGLITSGTQSPSLGHSIGIASIDKTHSKVGTRVLIDIRGTKVPAEVTSGSFYKRNY